MNEQEPARTGEQPLESWKEVAAYLQRDATAVRRWETPRQVFWGSDDIRFLNPRDWSPDGKWTAVTINRKDGTGQIALIAVADGTLRVLKSVDWNVPDHVFFSSDGKYIAYDLPADDAHDQRDIFVLAIDGSHEIPAVVNPAQESLLGWSPDDRILLFSSDRTGSMGVWGLPFVDGKPQGAPELLRADIGSSAYSPGLTTSGALYVWKEITSRDIKIARIDLNAGKLSGPPVSFEEGFLPRPTVPSWSPDGKYLAYAACGGDCLAIRSVDSGRGSQVTAETSVRERSAMVTGRPLSCRGRQGCQRARRPLSNRRATWRGFAGDVCRKPWVSSAVVSGWEEDLLLCPQ